MKLASRANWDSMRPTLIDLLRSLAFGQCTKVNDVQQNRNFAVGDTKMNRILIYDKKNLEAYERTSRFSGF
jgi:hypothetical protein